MNQVDFTRPGGFPIEQNTLARLQTAYKEEFFMAFKKHLGIEENKSYLLYSASKDEQGWLVVEGNLIAISATENKTNFIKITETRDALVFRSGAKHKVFITREAEHVNEIPVTVPLPIETNDQSVHYTYYDISTLEIITNIPDLNKVYLPLDGTSAMTGDLNLDGHKISALDVEEHPEAIIRAEELYLGSSNKRGTVYPNKPLGRALVDLGDTISINHEADWEHLKIDGNLSLSGLPDTQGHGAHPILIDENGAVTRSSGSFIGAVPLGMIALWSNEKVPYDWVLCDGYLNRKVNGFQIPDMRSQFFAEVKYIMHVGQFNRYPVVHAGEDKIIHLKQGELSKKLINLKGTATDDDGRILSHSWTCTSIPEELDCRIENHKLLETTAHPVKAGTYVFKLTAVDDGGAEWFDEKKVVLNKLPSLAITGETNLSILSGTAQTILTAHAEDPDGENSKLTYQWFNSVSNLISSSAKLPLSGLLHGNYTYKVVVKDKNGGEIKQSVIVRVTKDEQAPIVAISINKREMTLPENSITINGTITDANKEKKMKMEWVQIFNGITKVLSTSTTDITLNNKVSLGVDNLGVGNYIFKLIATDSAGKSHSAQVVVEVKQAVNEGPIITGWKDEMTLIHRLNPISTVFTVEAHDPERGNLRYNWFRTGVAFNSVILSNTDTKNLSVAGLTPGDYTFEVGISDYKDGKVHKTVFKKITVKVTQGLVIGSKKVSVSVDKIINNYRITIKGPIERTNEVVNLRCGLNGILTRVKVNDIWINVQGQGSMTLPRKSINSGQSNIVTQGKINSSFDVDVFAVKGTVIGSIKIEGESGAGSSVGGLTAVNDTGAAI